MGKSQETFNKKEKEKKRLRKHKDKAEKKEMRKANSDKGKSFEEMLAYVDENGNITTTPPDPKNKKQVFNEADIQISTMKRVEEEAPDVNRKGTVTFFNDSKGFGFIKDHVSQDSVFVHANGLLQPIKENDKVSFTTESGPKGLMAVNVKLES